jgi:hypothetical protein
MCLPRSRVLIPGYDTASSAKSIAEGHAVKTSFKVVLTCIEGSLAGLSPSFNDQARTVLDWDDQMSESRGSYSASMVLSQVPILAINPFMDLPKSDKN